MRYQEGKQKMEAGKGTEKSLWNVQEIRTQAHLGQVERGIPNKTFKGTVVYLRLELGAKAELEINLSVLIVYKEHSYEISPYGNNGREMESWIASVVSPALDRQALFSWA